MQQEITSFLATGVILEVDEGEFKNKGKMLIKVNKIG